MEIDNIFGIFENSALYLRRSSFEGNNLLTSHIFKKKHGAEAFGNGKQRYKIIVESKSLGKEHWGKKRFISITGKVL